ncbi:hypothetical protein [Reyranella sp.]|jgi:hypothetical protein|uniref:hypothetical protein n=1 Tax=Reyranella sp. TaxID=1929291 RepID=UPI002F95C06B
MPEEPSLYLFQCPLTKMNVKAFADAAVTARDCRLRWIVPCAACGEAHVVNVATGRVRVTVAAPRAEAEDAARAQG